MIRSVCTNAPRFEWHVTNLRNDVNLSATNVSPLDLDGRAVKGPDARVKTRAHVPPYGCGAVFARSSVHPT